MTVPSVPTAAHSGDATVPAVTPASRTWLRRIHGGGVLAETCPSWCTATHANDQGKMLDDLTHASAAVAMRFGMQVAGTDGVQAWPVLSATITQYPYLDGEADREPYVSFEPSPDDVIEMNPDWLAAMVAQIRAHADRLEQVHAQLVAAVAEHRAGLRVGAQSAVRG